MPFPGRTALLLAALVAPACAPPPDEAACAEARQDAFGRCCEGWLVPRDTGCVPRVWPAPSEAMDLGDPGAVRVEAAIDGHGEALVVWQANASNGLDTEVVVAEQRDDRWLLARPGLGLPGFGIAPTVATDVGGRALVTWKQQDLDTGAVYLAERLEDGTWIPPGPPLSFPPTAYEPRPVFAPNGEAIVVWNQWTGTGYGVAVARRPSDEPTGPLRGPADATDVLSPPVNFSNSPQVAVAANGDAVVTWYQSPNPAPGDATELVVFASTRYGESGSFTHPTRNAFVSAPGAPVDSHPIRNPLAAISPFGEIVIAWTQDDGSGAVPVFMAHRDGLGAWTPPAGLGDPFSPAVGRALSAQPAFGRGAELFVVWYQHRGAVPEVLGAHRSADGAWDVPGLQPEVLSTPGAEAVDPRLAVGPDGQAAVVWQERDGGPWRVMVRWRNAAAAGWSEPVALSRPGVDATAPTIAIGPTSEAVVAWTEGPALQAHVVVTAAR